MHLQLLKNVCFISIIGLDAAATYELVHNVSEIERAARTRNLDSSLHHHQQNVQIYGKQSSAASHSTSSFPSLDDSAPIRRSILIISVTTPCHARSRHSLINRRSVSAPSVPATGHARAMSSPSVHRRSVLRVDEMLSNLLSSPRCLSQHIVSLLIEPYHKPTLRFNTRFILGTDPHHDAVIQILHKSRTSLHRGYHNDKPPICRSFPHGGSRPECVNKLRKRQWHDEEGRNNGRGLLLRNHDRLGQSVNYTK